ncbi:AraC family transcriptional regulator [Bacillus sp. FJAT-49705]|uniref:AraC family transcriptional regulator n=1 Tax=Cytobacillus citreus TaxID=2833586 RepID=A0ABS5NXA1_9BACI|nr:AraC family transcriptional regulator [Cytobacillus citreus]MBS4192467.1 AraC family transcriptional regulator [Cytobacillus citreus]
MAWVESIQKAIDYMEEHLLEEISIERIASEANASAFHFQRTFTILTDMSIGEYMRRRRLTLAAQELSRTNCKIIDLAYKYGYDTPEAFTKAFRRQHGVTPSDARKYMGKLKFYERLIIQVILKGAEPMKYNVLERESFKVVGIKKGFSVVNDEHLKGIPMMWDQVNSDGTCDKLASINNGQIKGVLGVCSAGTNPGVAIDYWVAVEYDGEVPVGFSSLEIPAAKWVVFEVNGPMPEAMQNKWKQIFSEWFPTSGYKQAGIPELEVYSDDDANKEDYYSEIWIPVK